MAKILCNHCGQPARLITGEKLYPKRRDLAAKKFWLCTPCGAYVGCHQETEKPYGLLATREERNWRMRAHAAFDPIWQADMEQRKCSKHAARNAAYHWLAGWMNIPREDCHIGHFNVAQCQQVLEICTNRRPSPNELEPGNHER